MTSDVSLNPVSQAIAAAVGIAAGIWLTWCTVVAFAGGTLPLIGWEVDGGLLFGLVWVLFIDPAALLVAYWAGMLVALPLIAMAELAGRLVSRKKRH